MRAVEGRDTLQKVACNKKESNEMAHMLEQFEDGSTAFFTNREVAWHRLGTVTDGAQTVDDALRLAQLDWTVYKSDEPVGVNVLNPDGVQFVTTGDKYLTYRDHPKLGLQGLGVVGKQYTVIQNREAFDFLNALTDMGGAVFETAGSLNGGRRVFMSMKMPNGVSIGGGTDTLDLYLMALTSHNGTTAFTVAVTPIRPVCHNTVTLGLKQAQSTWTLKHTSNVGGRIAAARQTLGLVFEYEQALAAAVDEMASAYFGEKDFDAFLESLLPAPKKSSTLLDTRRDETMQEMKALLNAPTQQNIRNTKWAAYNAVVEWADWVKPVRGKSKDVDVLRAERNFVGANDGLKRKAYALLSR